MTVGMIRPALAGLKCEIAAHAMIPVNHSGEIYNRPNSLEATGGRIKLETARWDNRILDVS